MQPIENIGYLVQDIEKDIGKSGIFHLGVWLGTRGLFPAIYKGHYVMSEKSYEAFTKTEQYNILYEINILLKTKEETIEILNTLYNSVNLTFETDRINLLSLKSIDSSIESEKEIYKVASANIEYLQDKLKDLIDS